MWVPVGKGREAEGAIGGKFRLEVWERGGQRGQFSWAEGRREGEGEGFESEGRTFSSYLRLNRKLYQQERH